VEKHLQPLVEGGTGSESERPMQPDFLPDKYESGSHNAIGIAGLRAALEWVEDRGVDALREHDVELSQRFIERTRGVDGLTVHGPREASPRVAVFSVSIEGLEPAELSALLETEFGIMTRSGLHCAPLAHETIGTSERGGTARVSFGALSTLEDVDRCCDALAQLSGVKV
jgi:selenocysteine lyase/cysteine desulfurase